MFTIKPIRPEQAAEARQLIYRVAHPQFAPGEPFEQAVARWEAEGELADLDDVQRSYFEAGGAFLVLLEDGNLIGTGALRRLEDGRPSGRAKRIGELKRLWLLPEYHGQGLGYRMLMELIALARQKGYRALRLETHGRAQARALAFYRKAGFIEIPRYADDDPDTVAMEMRL